MLITYLRKDDNIPYACFVSDGHSRIGMSFCDSRDKFVKEKAKELAMASMTSTTEAMNILVDRIEAYKGKNPAIKADALLDFIKFRRRIKAYFKEN